MQTSSILVVDSVTARLTRAVAAGCAALAFSCASISPSRADEFTPLCSDLKTERGNCWQPIEIPDYQGCHFLISNSDSHFESPMMWSGGCRDGKAEGDGVLFDNSGNHAEGRLLAGVKDGYWRTDLADGGVITENYGEGRYHGLATHAFSDGTYIEVSYAKGRRHGPWQRSHPDGYSEAGSYENNRKHGTWTITWPDGVEASVPYVDNVVHGEVTVRRPEGALGILVYRDGKHVDGVLQPVLLREPGDP